MQKKTFNSNHYFSLSIFFTTQFDKITQNYTIQKKSESEQIAHVIETVEELPEKVQVIETTALDGSTKKQVIKKRTIKKQKGRKQEVTEIITREEENVAPITSVTVTESTVDESIEAIESFKGTFNKVQIVEEIPEKIQITEVKTRDGPRKTVSKKRVFKKKSGRKESVTEIVTHQCEGEAPVITVEVTEVDLPLEEVIEELKPGEVHEIVEELPEHIQVIETATEQGKTEKTIVQKRTIKKKKGNKEEITEILTKQEEGKAPETLVTFSEIHDCEAATQETIDEESYNANLRKVTISGEKIEEFKPELLVEFMKKSVAPDSQQHKEEKSFEVVIEEGKPIKKLTKQRITKKKLTLEEENIKRLLELEVSKTPLEDYQKVTYKCIHITQKIYDIDFIFFRYSNKTFL